MNRYGTYLMPPMFGNDVEFSEALRSRIRFAIGFIVFLVALLVLLWNAQPWFELVVEIKPADKTSEVSTKSASPQKKSPALQSNVEIIEYTVRAGDTLSEIAERYGIGLTTLMQYNRIDDPNALRAGQRLRIPHSAYQ
ncbi:MAG: LysM peptidoglycan-binding domain-containing protein [candidate division KSB1 bacterium]|nr:LysM peptidoglycan-binding domain-containing protein [candidate division KSB1 bacterium]